MNIRPITSTPRAIAFAGEESITKTTRQTKTKELPPEVEAKTLEKLGKLSSRQVVGVDLIPVKGWHTINLRSSKRNNIQTVSYPTDGSQEIQVVYTERHYKKMTARKSRNVEAKPAIIAYLNGLAEAVIARRKGIGHLRKP